MEEMKSDLAINSEELNNAIVQMENSNKKIEEIFVKIENTMKSFHNNEIWSGNTNDAYYDRFLELQAYFPKVNTSLSNFSKFLRVTNENYINAENSINNDVDKNNNELDVN